MFGHVRALRELRGGCLPQSLVWVWVDDIEPNQRIAVYGGFYHRPGASRPRIRPHTSS